MTTATPPLPPKLLGFWIKMVRTAATMSQAALAAAAGATERTVQRVEAGERVNLQTRRSLARGLGYDDLAIFDDPAFITTVTNLVESMRAEAIRAEEERHPDHMKIAVTASAKGADLIGLIGSSDATHFQCDDQAEPEAQAEAAALFDNLRDWGDLWSCLSYAEKLDAERDFDVALATLAGHGLRAYQGSRVGRLVSPTAALAPMPFTIAYLAIVPADHQLAYLLVPKQSALA